MKTVVKIDLNDKVYGGRVYENQMVNLLTDNVCFRRIFLMKYKNKLLNLPRLLFLLVRYKFLFKGTLLLTNSTTFFAGYKSKNIVIIHHIIEDIKSNKLPDIFQRYCDNYFLKNSHMYNQIVTVSKVWKDKLEKLGIYNTSVIYNSFNIEDYSFTEEEKNDFKCKYRLNNGQPIVYIGNCQEKKGVKESYENLKDDGYLLVTSGVKQVDIPVINLNLPFKEYKILLAVSDVVLTMSKFTEGWNRTAHEASLCGTPVIGTGTGGMHELLELSAQTELTDFTKLSKTVKNRLSKTYEPTKELLSLNNEYFKQEWLKVLT